MSRPSLHPTTSHSSAAQSIQSLSDTDDLHRLLNPLTADSAVCLKFKAVWCGPCKRIRMDQLEAAIPSVTWYEVDADQSPDILDYCGVTTIPAFLAIKRGVPQPLFQSSDTNQVEEWLRSVFRHG